MMREGIDPRRRKAATEEIRRNSPGRRRESVLLSSFVLRRNQLGESIEFLGLR